MSSVLSMVSVKRSVVSTKIEHLEMFLVPASVLLKFTHSACQYRQPNFSVYFYMKKRFTHLLELSAFQLVDES